MIFVHFDSENNEIKQGDMLTRQINKQLMTFLFSASIRKENWILKKLCITAHDK